MTNFNIGGTGTANILGAATQFNLGGFRILKRGNGSLYAGVSSGNSSTGSGDPFFGDSTGLFNTTGSNNSFFGDNTGTSNTTGGFNSFFGAGAGSSNTSSDFNSFFGESAGSSNTTGTRNSFFGRSSGASNTTSSDNSFFGASAGLLNTTGEFNAFFGKSAGGSNTTSNENSFFGFVAGGLNSIGSDNTFIGSFAGFSNTIGSNNTIVGRGAGVGANNLTFATAIGAGAIVDSSNTLVLGRSADSVQIPGALNINGTFGANILNGTQFNIGGNGIIGGNLGLGTTAPGAKLQVSTTALDQHLYLSSAAPSLALGNSDTRSSATMNSIVALATSEGHYGVSAGGLTIANYGNARGNIYINSNYSGDGLTNVILQPSGGSVGIGTTTPDTNTKLHVDAGNGEGVHVTSADIFSSGVHAIATGGTGVLGESTNGIGVKGASPQVGVQGVSTNGIGVFGLSVNGLAGYFQGKVQIDTFLSLGVLGGGGNTSLCRNSSTLLVSVCSSSLRYKTGIQPFSAGLEIIKRLRPISFTWKEGGMRDVGFAAEEVETVEPLLTFRNSKGEVEGVKYDRITVALVNAVREQQAQIEEQQQQMKQQQAHINQQQAQFERQQRQIDVLKKLVCADGTDAAICKAN